MTYTNDLVEAASPFLQKIVEVQRGINSLGSPGELRGVLIEDLTQFEKTLKRCNFNEKTILAARYCLCAALDEFVSLSEWGRAVDWSREPLLALIHKETWGGERFFIIYESMIKNPAQNWQLIELIYLLLCWGYEGKYYSFEKTKLQKIKDCLLALIESTHPAADPCVAIQPVLASVTSLRRFKIESFYFVLSFFFILLFSIANLATFYHARDSFSILSSYVVSL